MRGMSEGLIQNNFDKRVEALDAMIKSSLAELEFMMAPMESASAKTRGPLTLASNSRNVFLVHGHDEAVHWSGRRVYVSKTFSASSNRANQSRFGVRVF
jgi:hypothetical protein